MAIKVLIVDDHGLLRAGLKALLQPEPGLQVVGEAGDGEQTLALAARHKPDVVLLDLNLPDLDGIEITRRLLKKQPGLRILILTMHEDHSLLQEAIKAGASGYIIKRAVEAELITAIQAVSRGDLYVHPALMRGLLYNNKEGQASPPAEQETLTLRELDVLRLIAQGYTNRQVGDLLNLSIRTVESHRANLMDKLNARSRVDLVRYAAQHGLIETGGKKNLQRFKGAAAYKF